MKKVFYFIIFLLPWFLSGLLFSSYITFFDTLNLPWIALPKSLYTPVWIILYILIAISIYRIRKNNDAQYLKGYSQALVGNYIVNQLYLFFMFFLKNPFLGFVDSVAILITGLFLYYETKELDETSSKYLLPYIIFNIYATFLSLLIYFMNF